MESAVNAAVAPSVGTAKSREEWDAACGRVESYFNALGVRDTLLRSQLVIRVIDLARQRAKSEPDRPVMALAAEEMDHLVTEWFAAVLDGSHDMSDPMLSTRGRLALLLADMPGRWQDQFLKSAPWPEDFVRAMRESYLHAGPDFQLAQMSPRPLDLGAVATLTKLGNLPYFRMVLACLAFAAALVVLFSMTH